MVFPFLSNPCSNRADFCSMQHGRSTIFLSNPNFVDKLPGNVVSGSNFVDIAPNFVVIEPILVVCPSNYVVLTMNFLVSSYIHVGVYI